MFISFSLLWLSSFSQGFLGLFSLLVACGQLDTTTPEVNEELTPLLVHDSSVTLEDFSGSLQVSQGHGEVVLNIQGFELSGLKRAVLVSQQSIFGSRSNGQKATSYELKILEQTEKSARLQALIPHGSPLGAYDLKLNASKPITVMKVLTITPIISSPSGDDLTGKGTPDNPFRSLTRAVSVAQKGDFIKLSLKEKDILCINKYRFETTITSFKS